MSQLQCQPFPATIAVVQNANKNETLPASASPFQPGTLAVVTLGNPREKLWGAVLALTAEGLSVCGIELASFEDLVSMVKEGEAPSPSVIFFPMHRVERIELDLPDGNIPSLSQRFTAQTGLNPTDALFSRALRQSQPGEETR